MELGIEFDLAITVAFRALTDCSCSPASGTLLRILQSIRWRINPFCKPVMIPRKLVNVRGVVSFRNFTTGHFLPSRLM